MGLAVQQLSKVTGEVASASLSSATSASRSCFSLLSLVDWSQACGQRRRDVFFSFLGIKKTLESRHSGPPVTQHRGGKISSLWASLDYIQESCPRRKESLTWQSRPMNTAIWESEPGQKDHKASLGYIVSSGSAWTVWQHHFSKNNHDQGQGQAHSEALQFTTFSNDINQLSKHFLEFAKVQSISVMPRRNSVQGQITMWLFLKV